MIARMHRWLSTALVLMLVASLAAGPGAVRAAGPQQKRIPPLDRTLGRVGTQVLVRFAEGVSASRARSAIAASGGTMDGRKSASGNLHLARYSTPTGAASGLRTLDARSDVVRVFYNQKFALPPLRQGVSTQDIPLRASAARYGGQSSRGFRPAARPGVSSIRSAGGPLRPYQYYLDRIGDTLSPDPPANAPVVAVIDSGVDATHPDLAGRVMACPAALGNCDLVEYDRYPTDTNGHGTHVASTIAAPDDGVGITGVSPTSAILPVRVLGPEGFTDLATLFQAIDYVTAAARMPGSNVRVANMSLGGYALAGSAEHQEFNIRLRELKQAGVLTVVAAGNDSGFLLQTYPLILGVELAAMPAMSPSVLAVAATDQNDYRTFFSDYSTPIRVNRCANRNEYGECRANNTYISRTYDFAPLAAPGWSVLAALPHGQYLAAAGTSMSSPIVAGSAARVMSRYPSYSNAQVVDRLEATAVPLGVTKGFPIATRRVDLGRALGVVATGFTGRVMDGVSGQPLSGATVRMRDSAGATVATATTTASGFYTLTGAVPGGSYTLLASKTSGQPYAGSSVGAVATGGRLTEPGDISLVPRRTDGAYTIVTDWRNVLTGIIEWENQETFVDYDEEENTFTRYPWPVKASTMPMALLDAYFGVPFPGEPSDSTEFAWYNPGSMSAWPYARLQGDWAFELAPHYGVVVRQLPPVGGALRYGIKWVAPGGQNRPGATVRVYRGASLLRTSRLADAAAPNDGTRGAGRNIFSPSVWQLHELREGAALRTVGSSHGKRSDYGDWIHRNNDIRGTAGPAVGGAVRAELDLADSAFACTGDCADVYSVYLREGGTYTFKLSGMNQQGERTSLFSMELHSRKATTIANGEIVAFDDSFDAEPPPLTKTMRYTVRSGQAGRYYVVVYTRGANGTYTLSRPAP